MDTTWEASRLLTDRAITADLPQEILTVLRRGTNSQYLDAIAGLALDPAFTSVVVVSHEDILVEICSRWVSNLGSTCDLVQVMGTLAKILPLAPYLSSYARMLLHQHSTALSQLFSLHRITGFSNGPDQPLHHDLLMLYRLLAFSNKDFAPMVCPTQMQLMMNHPHRPTRYLAIRILCLYLHTSDESTNKMIKNCVGNESAIEASWEDKDIDYFFLNLWEKKRLDSLRKDLTEARAARHGTSRLCKALDMLESKDLSPYTARFGRVLIPRPEGNPLTRSSLVVTSTVERNMSSLAKAVRDSDSILVTGPSGAGKSSLIGNLARDLCRSSSAITIHLNEQTDIKLLLGLYTSDKTPGSFTWRAGILTQAVLEGRWVIVEDIDRAPADVISTLLPLLERGELFVQTRNESIPAAPGFKLFATIRSFVNQKGDLIVPGRAGLGNRHWTTVPVVVPEVTELAEIIACCHPILSSYIPRIMGVYQSLQDPTYTRGAGQESAHRLTRSHGLRELLRWCRRLDLLLKAAGVSSDREPISESTNDSIFLEAIDCFAGSLPTGSTKAAIVALISKELHIPAERVNYCLEARRPEFFHSAQKVKFGRASLYFGNISETPKICSRNGPFALTNDILRTLESVSRALETAEPCLLVGETGTGKTAIVQHLAALTQTRLHVVNLSQQSEAGDLLGGYKPVGLRTLATPLLENFEQLFKTTFSTKRNERYVDSVAKAIEKGRWGRVVAFWKEALQMVQSTFSPNGEDREHEPRSKKRRMELPKYQTLKARWADFESKLRVFQMHLASGSKGFAFSFMEGNIVKAARSGEWILLDEINLASPDTLESLADLLVDASEGGPSLLLSESGQAERIVVHKNFRIFGAMNPATDVGKRDLPIGLRSRFTEIFVDSPDRKLEDLIAVIEKYLGNHSNVDRRAAADMANLYLEVKWLAEHNAIVDGSNQKPHFSLRTLTRTLVYITDIAPIYGLRRSMYEGFSMSFLTLLSAESGLQVLSLIDKHVVGSQANGRALMKQMPRRPEDNRNYISFEHYWVAQGAHPPQQQPHYILTPFVNRNLLNLVRATSTRRFPILLQGPTSSGKTSMIEYLANMTGNKFLRINNHEHTDIQEYLGTYASDLDGSLRYQEGILVRALREGSWIVLDELNLAPTDVLEALNRLLDDNKELLIPETQEVIKPHENFMLFATQNPPGMYGGRKILSRAFRNRFLELHFDDIPEEELETILRERCQIAPSFCTRIVAVYRRLSLIRQKGRLFEQKNSFATLRDLFRWASRDADDPQQLAINGFLLLAERARDADERLVVKQVIEEIMKVTIDEKQIYNIRKARDMPRCSIGIRASTVWTKSMLRLYVLVTEALKHNEPVLLVGDTGSGKTTVCQLVAEHMGQHLHIVNAHQNMETSDLIGSQRPVRNRTQSLSKLAQDLNQVLKFPSSGGSVAQDLPALLSAYDSLSQYEVVLISPEKRLSIKTERLQAEALFEWTDGSLVQAMRAGQHFLLDEISLADDSVLERMNSVLEPSRTLLLAEKATDIAPITASHGFQIYATMNPGGDYGKKELSPALRNRFTEIWVPSVWDGQDLMDIAHAKLASDHLDLGSPMIAFATWYSTRYNPIAPSVSIRDLLSWIDFINIFGSLSKDFAVVQGAAMVYIDGLGADPAAKTWIPDDLIREERQCCLSRLSELFDCEMANLYQQEPSLTIDETTLKVGSFRLSVRQKIPRDPSYLLEAPTTKTNVMKIVRALQVKKPILLEGSPGVGKTTLVSAIAEALGLPLTRINLSEHTDLADLFGSDIPLEGSEVGRFGWHEAPFLKAMQNGEWVLLDEMNLASQSVLEGLNACLDHRGQVYVPELDQTFSRHDDFVVFAAQNPRHQGGGRKGLPASFVNRFTVVYVEEFTPDDLLMICSHAFQTCSHELIVTLTQCIAAVSAYMQSGPIAGLQGGPWEFNLRDAFRWLQLLTDGDGFMPAGSAVDYLDALFLQRLRTLEDRSRLSTVLERFFPIESKARSRFLTLSETYVQVGLGILARNPRACSVYAEGSLARDLDLPITESIIFCVQRKWPCLLVGPSGSGKTRVVNQLARIVGADVVTISLNADMDTIDLLGGYEQLDPQRRITAITSRLMKLITQTIAEGILAGNSHLSLLDVLVGHLQHPIPDLLQVIECLRKCARDVQAVDFGSVTQDLEEAVQQMSDNTKARFEWVDGVLVNALKDGAWLVLDNANLCSPSILDRLNSLLEPDGFLNISEHRAADGTARVVKPHPDFRLFLTVDPRHGELSRAMRNRSVEIFLFAAPAKQHPDLTLESSLSRFATFGRLDWGTVRDTHFLELSKICFDHLAFSDIWLSPRWYQQVRRGLIDIPFDQESHFSSAFQAYSSMLRENPFLLQKMRDIYQRVVQRLGTKMSLLGISDAQTLHPLNNPVLMRLSAAYEFTSDLQWLGSLFEFAIRLYGLHTRIERVRENANSKLASRMSHLELSFAPEWMVRNETVVPLGRFLRRTTAIMHEALKQQELEKADYVWLEIMNKVLLYAEDLSNVAENPPFDESAFQAYQIIGRSTVEVLTNHSTHKKLVASFSDALALFDETMRLKSGLSMESIWVLFRQYKAQDSSLLDTRLEFEELSDRFDSLSWTSRASLEELIALRSSIVQVFDLLDTSDGDSPETLRDIRNALGSVESTQRPASQVRSETILRSLFEALYQYSQCLPKESATTTNTLDPVLSLLSCQATKSLIGSSNATHSFQVSQQIGKCTGVTKPNRMLAAFRDTLGLSMLREFNGISEVPLKAFNMLCTEVKALAKCTASLTSCISTNHVSGLNAMLRQLHSSIIEVHEKILEPTSLARYRAYVDSQMKTFLDDDIQPVPVLQIEPELRDFGYFNEVFEGYFNPSLSLLHDAFGYQAAGQTTEEIAATAESWVRFFTGCLVLYVPDRVFDPASKPLAERDRHTKRRIELESSLWALNRYGQAFDGQQMSLRVQTVKSKLEALGEEPPIRSVTRPQQSALGELQAVFNTLLESVVRNAPSQAALQCLMLGDKLQKSNIELLRSHITRFTARLQDRFHPYDDITGPLMSFLHGLDIGLALALIAYDRRNDVDKDVLSVCRLTPFLGMEPDSFSTTTSDSLLPTGPHTDLRLLYLKSVAVVPDLGSGYREPTRQTVFGVFHSYYREWKEQLSKGQKENTTKSSLYRYRGSEDDCTDEDELEFKQIFHNDGTEKATEDETLNISSNPRVLAQCLAVSQRDLLGNEKTASQRVISVLHYSANHLSRTREDILSCPVPAQNFLPILIVKLHENWQLSQGAAVTTDKYDFYAGANVSEVGRLTKLLHLIQTRYTDLKEAWPEHVTIQDVLRVSTQLLDTRHTEPIAKLLTKAEQLHDFMHEWQLVASRESSVADLYERLTSLLIDWRRLELSTWARLLDKEDAKCAEDVDAWWFVVYEAIVAVPLSMTDSSGCVGVHADHLLATLTEFLSTTSMGHYVHRLRLIECFRSYVQLLVWELPVMKTIENALHNFLNFYNRFSGHIRDSLRAGRKALEKDLREIVLLASWKDTNIKALRESAKRSHHKLFKVIRKYRTLLSQPVGPSLLQVLPDTDENSLLPARPISISKIPDLTPALQVCQESLPLWSSKSARFRNPIATTVQMENMSKIPSSATDVADHIYDHVVSLLENIKLLQNETPATKTKDNVHLIKHLKSRKRKLFVDTLKDVRQMGFQSNISVNILTEQASVAKVLSMAPAFKHIDSNKDLAAADAHWHTMLAVFAQIREKSAHPSDDLSPVERSRSLGYLESMLSAVLRERATLTSHFDELHHLSVVLGTWEHLAAPDLVPFECTNVRSGSFTNEFCVRLGWLPPLLNTACVLLQKHGVLGDLNNSAIVKRLAVWDEQVGTLASLHKNLPELPKGLTSLKHEQTYRQTRTSLHELNANLQHWAQEFPEVGFVLRQLKPWTEMEVENPQEYTNGIKSINLTDFDKNLSRASDSILVAVQQMKATLGTVPSNHEEGAWLVRTMKSYSNGLKSLQVSEVASILHNSVQQFRNLAHSHGQEVKVASAACAMALPIIQQYRHIVVQTLDHCATGHRAFCKLVATLAKSYLQIVSLGFCEPTESSASETGRMDKVEEGTGLGEGEGAEDISKDIQNDEDLTELAQDKGTKEEDGVKSEDDAVDMNYDELEGDLKDASGSEVGDGIESGEEAADIDEEIGDVMDLNPEAVDEKLWDGSADEARAEKEGENAKGKPRNDEKMAVDGRLDEETAEDDTNESGNEEAGEDEEVISGEKQKLDPHLEEEENLNLPEDMDLDNCDRSIMSELQGSDLDEGSNIEEHIDDQRTVMESTSSDEDFDLDDAPDNISDVPLSQENGRDADAAKKAAEDGYESPLDTEPEDELSDKDPSLLQRQIDDAVIDPENVSISATQGQTQGVDEQNDDEQHGQNSSQNERPGQAKTPDQDNANVITEKDLHESGQQGQNNTNVDESTPEDNFGNQAFKKLGDALERWHRQHQDIRNSREAKEEPLPKPSEAAIKMKDFEHLHDEDSHADAQALGAATEEQAQALERQAFETEMQDHSDDFQSEQSDQDMVEDNDGMMQDEEALPSPLLDRPRKSEQSAFVGKSDRHQFNTASPANTGEMDEADVPVSEDTFTSPPHSAIDISTRPPDEARQLWSHYESLTHPLSLILTEQLRLILAPTLATKMRGDFRTGKRLNIKRIIPYIASNYKRDKIWMRRSVPQKRNYQIMLAVDDSKSMGESGSGQLAFEALVLVTKSLGMLEVGEIAVVGFGEHVNIAHEFGKPFSAEAGVNIIRQLGFKQTKTNVRKLVIESIELFRDARAKAPSSSATELWQLLLIISDGICEDHDIIRRLVRQAQEERIMIVFVIVDAVRGESIVDMSQAVFEPDFNDEGGQKLKIKRYLDGFPFMYYLVVADMRELPGVLASALRGWFSEVVGEGG